MDEVILEMEYSWQRECFHVKVLKLLEKLEENSYGQTIIIMGMRSKPRLERKVETKQARPRYEF